MIKLSIETLSEDNLHVVNDFSCIEPDDNFNHYNSKHRKKIRNKSLNIDLFLKNEALREQKNQMNKTHLFMDRDSHKLVGFVSICNDNIPLGESEKAGYESLYANVPALKIARLAVDKRYHKQGIGKIMIEYVALLIHGMRKYTGIKFITLDCFQHRIGYYKRFGFCENEIQKNQSSPDHPISMHLEVDKLLEEIE